MVNFGLSSEVRRSPLANCLKLRLTTAMDRAPADVTECLPPLERLAIAYAPRRVRVQTAALFALDTQLRRTRSHASEPLLVQIRLAWWREQLSRPQDLGRSGEPSLAALLSWGEMATDLTQLVDGWEQFLLAAAGDRTAPAALADAHGHAFAQLAKLVDLPGERDAACQAGRLWSLANSVQAAAGVGEGDNADAMDEIRRATVPKLSRPLRPLQILAATAKKATLFTNPNRLNQTAIVLLAMRVGIMGQ